MKGIIYLMCDPLTECFKIGVTKRNVNKRLKEIQTGNPGEVFVLKTFESENPYKIENILHRLYSHKKTINEWFSLNAEDVNSFETLCRKYENILNSFNSQSDFL